MVDLDSSSSEPEQKKWRVVTQAQTVADLVEAVERLALSDLRLLAVEISGESNESTKGIGLKG